MSGQDESNGVDSVPVESPANSSRRGAARLIKPILVVATLGFAVHVLLPQVGNLGQGLLALREGRWPFLLLAVASSTLIYVAGAWMVRESVDKRPAWGRTTAIQLAASAAAIVTPAGVGWVAVNEAFLRKEDVDAPTARAATGLNMILTAVSHVGLFLLLLPLLPTMRLPSVSPPQRRIILDLFVIAGVAAGLVFWIPRWRRKTVAVMAPILSALPGVVLNPKRSLTMLAGAVGINLSYGLALYFSAAAFGPAPPLLGIVVAYLVGATIAAIAPTPGGLGVMEAALVAALSRLAVPAGQAVAATLAFRIATFWIPLAGGAYALHRARQEGWL